MGTRRDFLCLSAAGAVRARLNAAVVLRIQLVLDSRMRSTPQRIHAFWSDIWAEAVRDFGRCGIHVESQRKTGEIRLSPGGRPLLTGLEPGVINLVVTDYVPMHWDNGRGVSGLTTIYEGFHLCVIALNHAHGHQIPFLSVNTCVHELLHVLLHDIFEARPKGFGGGAREFRVDLYATRLWLFRDGIAVRKAAEAYIERSRSRSGALTVLRSVT